MESPRLAIVHQGRAALNGIKVHVPEISLPVAPVWFRLRYLSEAGGLGSL